MAYKSSAEKSATKAQIDPRSAAWALVEICFRYGGQLIVTLVLARLLQPADFGLVAMLLVGTSIAMLFVDAGLGPAIVQRPILCPDHETTAFWFMTIVAVLAWSLLALSSPLVANAFGEPLLARLLPVMALTIFFNALAAVPDALITRSMLFKRRAGIEAISAIGSTGLALLTAAMNLGVWALVVQAVAAAALRAAACWLISGWRPAGRIRRHSLTQLLGFGGNLMVAGLLDVLSLRLQSVLIGRLYGSSTLGLYTVAYTCFQAPVSIVSAMLNKFGLAVLSRAAGHTESLRVTLQISVRSATFLSAPVMLTIALLSEPIVQAAFGPQWIGAAPLLAILALSGMFWPIHVLNQVAINAIGRSDLFLKLAIAKKCLAITLIVMGSLWGAVGVAYALLASSLLSLALNARYLETLMQYGMRPQLRDHADTLLALGAQTVTGQLVLVTLDPGGWRTGFLVAAPLAAYFATAFLIRHRSLRDIGELRRMAHTQLAATASGDTA
ncbi:lipopolysaccharide biosynthesis protein [Fontimonas sp. SYSU GA230001]|uniref:lipopolysaccharide biosynthesis protein n=1 Tax=Fontimonas sp. SYSU GA230001 TaxID=3142450 RepID=UPI0032B5CA1D